MRLSVFTIAMHPFDQNALCIDWYGQTQAKAGVQIFNHTDDSLKDEAPLHLCTFMVRAGIKREAANAGQTKAVGSLWLLRSA